MTSEFKPREFRVARTFRFLAPAYFLLNALFVVNLRHFAQANPPLGFGLAGWLLVGIWLVLLAAIALIVLRTCTVIDEHGVHRRRVLRWDFWPWDAFQSGKILKWDDDTYLFPNAKPTHRVFFLGFLGEGDRELLSGILERFWVSPPRTPTICPITIHFSKYRRLLGNCKSIRFDKAGVHFCSDRANETFLWNQVTELWIEYNHHRQSSFSKLKLMVPGKSLRLLVSWISGRGLLWSGATPAELAGLLLDHVPSDRVKSTAICGPPRDMEELEARRKVHQRTLALYRGLSIFNLILQIVIVVALIAILASFVWLLGWQALADGQPFLLFLSLQLITTVPIIVSRQLVRRDERKLAMLNAWESRMRKGLQT